MAGDGFPTPLVTTGWLASHLTDSNLRVLDGSWYLPQSGRDARAEYRAGHIPGAVFCDLDALSEAATPLPHMLPSATQFARGAGALGVGMHTRIVVYDGSGYNMSAARVWWMFRAFGHAEVAVLDGGLRKWRAEGRPLEPGWVSVTPAAFTPGPSLESVRSLEEMRRNTSSRKEQVLDARSHGRFAGIEPEPRAGIPSGHIPGSRNLPFQELTGQDGALLPPEQLRARFAAAGIDLSQPVIATCGSGTSACALLLGLRVLGAPPAALYDGSWTEWAAV